jgi:hypothetical protein
VSFIVTVHVREGIVMAADSRLTLTTSQQSGTLTPVSVLVPQSDANYKLFLSSTGIGLSTFGAADIGGVPLAGFVDSFLREKVTDQTLGPGEVASLLLDYFAAMPQVPDAHFHVAGYKTESGVREQEVWYVHLAGKAVTRMAPAGSQGTYWGGESDVIGRLFGEVGTKSADGSFAPLPQVRLPWQYFTLQDAVDFAVYAVRTTIDTLRFMPRPKTVGGPIDVLLIMPSEARWLARKELHV